jgi:hypothetical protein
MSLSFVACTLVGCAEAPPPVQCGGKVRTFASGPVVDAVLASARLESKAFCTGDYSGCNYQVLPREGGWMVVASFARSAEGRCFYLLDDERYFLYDSTGRLEKIMDSI